MADVLLTHSYHRYFDRKQTRELRPYPPLSTVYAAALLRRTGISVASWSDVCVKADAILGRCPGVRVLGDHILLRLERTSL
jgi:hypothetical protein